MKDDTISRAAAIDAMMKLQAEDIEAYGASIPEGFDGDRAVTAIKALPSAQLAQDLPNGCTDTISRAAVGDALNRIEISRNASWYEFYQKALTAVGNLPSAQPTDRNGQERTGTDLISRQAAIDAVSQALKRTFVEYEDIARTIIGKLPSAQPERQKGEWIDYTEDGYVECPFCHSATNCDGNKDVLHFCFSCGADMRGKQDG